MKNQLIDLNTHLFAQLERINDEDLSDDELKKEIDRSHAITGLAKAVTSNAALAFKAARAKREHGIDKLPLMIGEPGD